MSASANVLKRTRRGGQTLIIALLILGVLLVLGLVFLGLISRNIATGVRSTQRSIGNDLAEAGIRYAHGQLLKSGLGADWRVPITPNVSQRDPDFDYLQAGGPDGLGNYGRVMYDQGRVLVRARYGPSDANVFTNNPSGPLIIPGRAKNYIIIESIGKPGKLNINDPTLARDLNGQERERLQTRKLIAFASIGIIEQAFFVTNKFNVSRPIEVGAPRELGVQYNDINGTPNPVFVQTQLGDMQLLPDKNGGFSMQPYGGTARFNGDVVFHGDFRANINKYFGDSILGTGSFIGADDVAGTGLTVIGSDINPAGNWANFTYTLANTGANSLNSRNPLFSTAVGTVRDGMAMADRDGFPRGNRRNEAPSFLVQDNSTGESIYRSISRNSGLVISGGNSGIYGHGRNVYVNNSSDRQNRIDEQGREIQETHESLTYDWLNPNNGQSNSGWQGAFYVPRGAYMQLLPDGFLIMRDSRAEASELTWKLPGGGDSTNTVIRYRIGNEIVNGRPRTFIINSIANPGSIGAANPDYREGFPFDGVVYFEGNVRVRGAIPTDVQLSVVSGGTIYIEGSITKGIVENQVVNPTLGTATGNRINRSSRSMLMLAAKDYVALNTSQFFGPAPSQVIEEVNDLPSGLEYNPLRMRRQATPGTPSSYLLRGELLMNPTPLPSDLLQYASNPSLWRTYGGSYQEAGTTNFIDAGILITHTMDDGPATNSFISLDINFGVDSPGPINDWQYLFDLNASPTNPYDPFQSNNASDYAPYNVPGFTEPNYGVGQVGRGQIYGIGAESWQRYGRVETTFFPIARSSGSAGGLGTYPLVPSAPEHGAYSLLAQETNDFTFRFNDVGFNASNDYLIARAAIVPNDVRVEASIFAEEGSFFVIPSPWFNPNPNDRRDTYLTRVAAIGQAQAQAERYQNYGSAPITPFYGEPIDVKVKIVGSVSQNMTAPMSQQAEWLKKWGWIPRSLGDSGRRIPEQHVPAGVDLNSTLYVPNLIITYDPALGSGRAWDPAFATQGPFYWQNPALRTDDDGRMLAPMPRLPVSPTLAYFGEVNQ